MLATEQGFGEFRSFLRIHSERLGFHEFVAFPKKNTMERFVFRGQVHQFRIF